MNQHKTVQSYGLFRDMPVYQIHGHRLELRRIDAKRVLFRTLGDRDDEELWVSLSPEFVRLAPTFQEDYEDKDQFVRFVQKFKDNKSIYWYNFVWISNYTRHLALYKSMKDWWRDKVGRVKTVNERRDDWWFIHYDFRMEDCWHPQVKEHLLAIHEHARDKFRQGTHLRRATQETQHENPKLA